MDTKAIPSVILLASVMLVAGQRPFFAGTRPIGYPELANRTTTESLGNRFGEGTTERLPLEANGDRELVDRISKLPVDKQPFWFINWQALEAQRKNPQSYPQKPNPFLDSSSNTATSNNVQQSTSQTTNFGFTNSSSNAGVTHSPSNTSVAVNSNAQSNADRAGFGNGSQNWKPIADRFGDIGIPNSNASNVNKLDHSIHISNTNGFNRNTTKVNTTINESGNGIKNSNDGQVPTKKIEHYSPMWGVGGYGR